MPRKWQPNWKQRYAAYLASAEWAAKRIRVLDRDNHRCMANMAGCTGRATQVHHREYDIVEDQPEFDLVSVCASCHEKITKAHRGIKNKRADLAEVWRKRLAER